MPDRLAGAQDRPDQVGRRDVPQQPCGDILDPARRPGDPGIVDQRVDPAERADDVPEQTDDLFLVADIAPEGGAAHGRCGHPSAAALSDTQVSATRQPRAANRRTTAALIPGRPR